MLWLCLHFPRLSASAIGADASDVVADQRGSKRWLIVGNEDAAAGMSLPAALSLLPNLRVRARKPAAEAESLRVLGWWAYRFGQPVATEVQDPAEEGRVPRAFLWVEIGASLALFGGLEALRDRLCSELMELGHAVQIGIAPTRAGAALLAVAQRSDPVLDPPALRARLEDLPLRLLPWPGAVLEALHGVGLSTLGELFRLPRDAFARRFGHDRLLALDRLLGEAPDPCAAIVPPDTFRRRFELASETEDTERLLFPLRRLCAELEAYLRTRDRGVRGVTLLVRHASARETPIAARFVDPHRDARRVLDALRERLDRDGLPLPARELVLVAEDFAEAVVPQSDLFDADSGRAQAWAAVLERLRGRLGDEQVWTPEAVADHRPERAWRAAAPAAAGRASTSPASSSASRRPALLVPEPRPIPAPSPLPPLERIESGWWEEDVARDYGTVEIDGARAWVYREAGTGAWFLHGWWS